MTHRSTAAAVIATAVGCTLAAIGPATAAAAHHHHRAHPTPVTATVETPAVFADDDADADDPAIWYNTAHPADSLVIGAIKEAGIQVYRLDGSLVQSLPAGTAPGGFPGRINNIDMTTVVVDGHRVDVAVASDRGSDHVRIYRVRPDHPDAPLAEITDPAVPPVFFDSQADVDGDNTAYGLTTWTNARSGRSYALVTRSAYDALALVELRATADGTVTYHVVRTLRLPDSFRLSDGSTWSPCEDPGEQPQAEGLVVDAHRGVLYAAQEDVGIWRIPADLTQPGQLIDRVRDFGVPAHYDAPSDECVVDGPDPGVGGQHLTADVEGLTLSEHRLIASSQGDDTFATYRADGRNQYAGSFQVTDGVVDGSQGCDGLAILDRPLGGSYPQGLLVVQDGTNTGPDAQGRESTNLKFVDPAALPH